MTDVSQLRADFVEPSKRKVIEELISLSAIRVPLPLGIANPLPASFSKRCEVIDGVLQWYGASVPPNELDQLGTLRSQLSGPSAEFVTQLIESISARVVYGYSCAQGSTPASESWRWFEIETNYDPNEIAEQLRSAYQLRRPDPDEVPLGGDQLAELSTDQAGANAISPQVLWGCMPLEDGWAMLPFLNTTDEIYLRILPQQSSEPESALVSGAAILGNDDPRVWHIEPKQQRWNTTLLDADVVEGRWNYTKAGVGWSLQKADVTLWQPELVMNGFVWISTMGQQ